MIVPRSLIALACCAATCAALAAEPTAERFWASASVVHRTLEEQGATGVQLLTETGPMLELRVGAHRDLGHGAALAAEFSAAGGALDYDGQTQGGVPLQTDSDHRDAGARIMWRPVPAQPWGEPWLVLGWHRNVRDISSTATAGGLRETSSATLVGLRWVGPLFPATPQWQVRLEGEAGVSVQHRLQVDFQGLYDAARLDGGRQRRTVLRLVGTAASMPWDWALEWAHLNQAVSPSSPLRRGGVLAGSVRQPHLTNDDVALRLTRRF